MQAAPKLVLERIEDGIKARPRAIRQGSAVTTQRGRALSAFHRLPGVVRAPSTTAPLGSTMGSMVNFSPT